MVRLKVLKADSFQVVYYTKNDFINNKYFNSTMVRLKE